MVEKTEEQTSEERETSMSKSSQLVLQISGAALFGALSLVVSAFTTEFVPRVPGWGIAIIDPVSIIWVMCFLVFGAKSGILCCLIGTFGLMPFDTSLPIVGPIMKFSATLSLIIVPILFLKLYRNEEGVRNSQKIKKPRNYVVYGLFGVILRILIMMLLNCLLFITILAYTIIHTIRYKLKSKGINYSWDSIRKIVKSQVRITTSMKCEDGRVFYLRKSSVLNEKQKEIYDILGIRYRAGMNTRGYM